MDYEFRIELLEKELAHYREMQKIMRTHVDAHDDHLAKVNRAFELSNARMDRVELELEKAALLTSENAAAIKNLIAAIAREHSNGSTN